MNKNALLWFIVTVSIVLFFLYGIPIDIYNMASILIPMFGGALFGVSLYYFLKNLKKDNEHYYPVMFPVISAILMGIVFLYQVTTMTTSLLQEEGVITTGVILDGSGMKSRRGGSFDITVRFKDDRGYTQTREISVGENSFDRLSKGQEISIIYHPENPAIVEAILTKEDIRNYLESGEKGLEVTFSVLNDISKFTQTETENYFQKYTLWTYKGTSKYGEHWINATSKENLYKSEGQIIYTAVDLLELGPMKSELRSQGFELIKDNASALKDSNASVVAKYNYQKDDSEVIIRQLLDMSGLTTIVAYNF